MTSILQFAPFQLWEVSSCARDSAPYHNISTFPPFMRIILPVVSNYLVACYAVAKIHNAKQLSETLTERKPVSI